MNASPNMKEASLNNCLTGSPVVCSPIQMTHKGETVDIVDIVEVEDVFLDKEIFPPVPLPREGMPPKLLKYLERVSDSMSMDLSIALSLVFPLVGSAIGNAVNISPRKDWKVSPFVWLAVIGETGSGKSPLINELMLPFWKKQNENYSSFERELNAYKARKNKNIEESPERSEPKLGHIVTTDFTIEALACILRDAPRGILIPPDEIGGLILGLNQYKKAGGNDRQKFLELFDGKSWKIDRKMEMPLVIPKPGASIIGGIQPKMLPEIFRGNGFEDGLNTRFLWASIEEGPIKFDPRGINESERERWENLLKWAWEIPFRHDGNEIDPFMLTLSGNALAHWVEFYKNMHSHRLHVSDYVRVFIPKLITYSLKLACIYHLLGEWGRGSGPTDIQLTVTQEAVEHAIKATEFFGYQAVRYTQQYSPRKEINNPRTVLIEALYQSKDRVRNGRLLLSDIRNAFNSRVPTGARLENNNRQLGQMLRSIGFETRKRSGGLFGIDYDFGAISQLYKSMSSTSPTSPISTISTVGGAAVTHYEDGSMRIDVPGRNCTPLLR